VVVLAGDAAWAGAVAAGVGAIALELAGGADPQATAVSKLAAKQQINTLFFMNLFPFKDVPTEL
jgi:hypothetical protein